MGAAICIETPLGTLKAALDADGFAAGPPVRRSRLSTGGEVLVWSDVGGLVVDALLTPGAPFKQAAMDLPLTHMWGIEWRLYARVDTADVTLSAMLPDDIRPGWPAGDEHVITLEHETADWCLAIGGPDEERLTQLAEEGRQPASWRAMPPASTETGRGIVWRLPALSAGETGRLHVAVAWCRTGHPRSQDAAWMAVDTSPSALRIGAGVPSRHEERRAARGT